MKHDADDIVATGTPAAFTLTTRSGALYGAAALDPATGHLTGDGAFQRWYGALTRAQRYAARAQITRQLAGGAE